MFKLLTKDPANVNAVTQTRFTLITMMTKMSCSNSEKISRFKHGFCLIRNKFQTAMSTKCIVLFIVHFII